MADSKSNVDTLIEQGLQLYSQGKLDDALARWRTVLELKPEHNRVKDYIRYVEENRTALEESFRHSPSSEHQSTTSTNEEVEEPFSMGGAIEEMVKEAQSLADSSGRKTALAGTEARNLEEEWVHLSSDDMIEPTARMDEGELKAHVERSRTPSSWQRDPDGASNYKEAQKHPLSESERNQVLAPLSVVTGGGEAAPDDFAPLENTPVGLNLPEPSRVIRNKKPSNSFGFLDKTPAFAPRSELIRSTTPPPRSPSTFSATPVPRKLQVNEGVDQDKTERVHSTISGARQLFEQGTYEGSLWLCERVLSMDPDNSEAKALLKENRGVLLNQYKELLGDIQSVPVVQIPQHEIMWHKLDHRAGFILSRIDGQLTFEDIIDVSGMGEFEASRILSQLLNLGVIGPRR